ncbi:MAG: pseudouridine synthase [Pseudomonadota bacterium]
MPVILLNKPFHVLSQFRSDDARVTLADFVDVPGVYPAGRLDFDSEGLLLLTDDGGLQSRIASPRFKLPKTYWVQVEGAPNEQICKALHNGVALKDGMARADAVRLIESPDVWPRRPPIRVRKSVPDHWLSLTISEGRNRQVRRMTAAAGAPTLRLIRQRIGPWELGNLQPGESISLSNAQAWRQLKQVRRP